MGLYDMITGRVGIDRETLVQKLERFIFTGNPVRDVHCSSREMLLETFAGTGREHHYLETHTYVNSGAIDPLRELLTQFKSHRDGNGYDTRGRLHEAAYSWDTGTAYVRLGESCPLSLDDHKKNERDQEETELFNVEIEINFFSSDKGQVDSVIEVLNRFPLVQHAHINEHPGAAYVMTSHPMNGISIVPIGLSGMPLERGNYSSDAVAGYDRAVQEIQNPRPSGRLFLLDGPPGTGKTHMVRGFMDACPRSKFVVIPSHLVKELADPNMIVTFIQEIDSDGPLVLVLEDADICLSERKAENMSSISAILNLSDGIVGSMLDLRILATTNSNVNEFDPAILRRGRLAVRFCLGRLDERQSQAVWKRISGLDKYPERCGEEAMPTKATLAELYGAYNDLPDELKAKGEVQGLVAESVGKSQQANAPSNANFALADLANHLTAMTTRSGR